MTRQEYLTAYRSVRKSSPRLIKSTMTQIRQAYITASEKVAEQVRVAQLSGMSDFTITSWQNINYQLNESIGKISEAIAQGVPASAGNFSSRLTAVDEQYLLDANARAGAGLSAVTIKNMFVKVNDNIIANVAKRVYSDGYTFSQRCWRIGTGVQTDMKQVLLSGLAQGRDPIKIAKDLEVYVADGKESLMKRYGNLKAGTKEFAKRIPRNVDYRAMRIVRSELYASLKETGLESGRANPSALDAYDWIMQAGRADWDCSCPDYAHNSPYTYSQVPIQPHPNCHPKDTMILTHKGNVPIQDVMPNDYILSHDGTYQRVISSWRKSYNGDMITVETKKGDLVMTPEHPILSNGKWVIAHSLKRGDSITSIGADIKPILFTESISDDSPSKGLKESGLFRILFFLSVTGMPIPAIDFNGELYILKSEVDIVSTDSEVRERLLVEANKRLIHHILVRRPELTGIELRYLGLMFIRVGNTPLGIMCGSSYSFPSSSITSIIPIGDTGKCESEFDKILIDTTPGDSDHLGYCIDREILVPEELCQKVFVDIDFNTHNTDIVDVKCEQVNTIVYNMTVENTHSFFANGFASHNCGCYVVARLMDTNEFVADLKRWSNGESVDYIDTWKAKYYDFA